MSLPFVHTARRCYRWYRARNVGRPTAFALAGLQRSQTSL